MMRLGDLDALSEKMKGTNRYFDIKFDIDEMPTIDPETLPIVKELRAEIERLNRGIENLSKNVESAYKQRDELRAELEKVKAERDAAVKQLHGYCPACKNYTENQCDGPCSECKHEYYQYKDASSKDNWEWRGVNEDK